jgi:uncharacterized protein YutE (UPF0331/DUF86 family)
MTDLELIRKKLERIESLIGDLRRLARPERLGDDLREERFVEHTLMMAIESAIDVGLHIVAEERLGEPQRRRETFVLLARAGWIDSELSAKLQRMVGFRNVLVHEYDHVDLARVREVLEHDLGDLLLFVGVIRERIRAG